MFSRKIKYSKRFRKIAMGKDERSVTRGRSHLASLNPNSLGRRLTTSSQSLATLRFVELRLNSSIED